MLAELRRIGADGRKRVVDEWAPFLPAHADPTPSGADPAHSAAAPTASASGSSYDELVLDDDTHGATTGSGAGRARPEVVDARRRQATAIVMLGVLGAEFGAEMEPSRRNKAATMTSDAATKAGAPTGSALVAHAQGEKKNVMEGFGLTMHSHSMHTSKYCWYFYVYRYSVFTSYR